MTHFKMHTIETAPEASRPMLKASRKELGFVPNQYAGLADSPVALKAYLTLSDLFAKSSLSPIEQQVVALAVSVENECEFCVSAHSTIARGAVKVPTPIIDALREGRKLPDAKLEILASFVRTVIRSHGWVNDSVVKTFIDAGYTRAQMLDVILGVSMKTLSNYTNNILRTPLNKEFEGERWTRAKKAA